MGGRRPLAPSCPMSDYLLSPRKADGPLSAIRPFRLAATKVTAFAVDLRVPSSAGIGARMVMDLAVQGPQAHKALIVCVLTLSSYFVTFPL